MIIESPEGHSHFHPAQNRPNFGSVKFGLLRILAHPCPPISVKINRTVDFAVNNIICMLTSNTNICQFPKKKKYEHTSFVRQPSICTTSILFFRKITFCEEQDTCCPVLQKNNILRPDLGTYRYFELYNLDDYGQEPKEDLRIFNSSQDQPKSK